MNDALAVARTYIGKATYRRYVHEDEAPFVVNCITLARWIYRLRGISLPPDYLSWLALGTPIARTAIAPYDLVFTDGYRNQLVEVVGKIGHVGIVTERDGIIHATTNVGIEEISLDLFFKKRTFCCARRIPWEGA